MKYKAYIIENFKEENYELVCQEKQSIYILAS